MGYTWDIHGRLNGWFRWAHLDLLKAILKACAQPQWCQTSDPLDGTPWEGRINPWIGSHKPLMRIPIITWVTTNLLPCFIAPTKPPWMIFWVSPSISTGNGSSLVRLSAFLVALHGHWWHPGRQRGPGGSLEQVGGWILEAFLMEKTGVLMEMDGDLWGIDYWWCFICDMSQATCFEGVPTWLVVYGTYAPHIAQASFCNQRNL